jgi:small subunit ribosomal protein S3
MVKSDDMSIDIFELKNPDSSAVLIAKNIAHQIERRSSFRRAIKLAIQNASRAGVKGIKVSCSGRINGADIARTEFFKSGSVPLHKLRADIDYSVAEAHTTYGLLGIKVWVYKGDFLKASLEDRG